jgi:hypothetical protein
MKRILFIFLGLFWVVTTFAQDQVFNPNIKTVKLYRFGDQLSFPVVLLGATDGLELHFDDLDNRYKNYYYTFQLCNADWSPGILHPFEYIKGFQNVKISTYRNSSIANTRYIHYQANVPDRNCYPTRSGNYLLKVFLDNDTSKLVFTKRMVVVDTRAAVAAQILQPYNSALFRTAQKLSIAVQTDNRMQVLSPNDIKVVILQNNNWQTSLYIDKPTVYRGNYYEYNDDAVTTLPGGKEFRWSDLRSFRLKGDRVQDIDNHGDTVKINMMPDVNRSSQAYVYYRDVNGRYTVETIDEINPFWQTDYAMVHFRYAPPGNKPFPGNDLYLFGEFTNYASDTTGRMHFNTETGFYEKTLFLKEGYYNYLYALKGTDGNGFPDFTTTEGNYYATENSYIVFVYYRPFGARVDEVVAYTILNSVIQR